MPCVSEVNWDVRLNVNSSLLIFSRLILPLGILSTAVFLSSSVSSCLYYFQLNLCDQRGRKWDNCNNINNKILKREKKFCNL